jgi:hypothetical protein
METAKPSTSASTPIGRMRFPAPSADPGKE